MLIANYKPLVQLSVGVGVEVGVIGTGVTEITVGGGVSVSFGATASPTLTVTASGSLTAPVVSYL